MNEQRHTIGGRSAQRDSSLRHFADINLGRLPRDYRDAGMNADIMVHAQQPPAIIGEQTSPARIGISSAVHRFTHIELSLRRLLLADGFEIAFHRFDNQVRHRAVVIFDELDARTHERRTWCPPKR